MTRRIERTIARRHLYGEDLYFFAQEEVSRDREVRGHLAVDREPDREEDEL